MATQRQWQPHPELLPQGLMAGVVPGSLREYSKRCCTCVSEQQQSLGSKVSHCLPSDWPLCTSGLVMDSVSLNGKQAADAVCMPALLHNTQHKYPKQMQHSCCCAASLRCQDDSQPFLHGPDLLVTAQNRIHSALHSTHGVVPTA